MQEAIISKTIRANAVSSYLLLFISWLFLFNKDNNHINNNFVKSHTKIAILIHLSFLITYIVFILYWSWINFSIFDYNLDDILSISLFLILFIFLIFWIYKANKWEIFEFSNLLNFRKKEKIINTNDSSHLNEKDKLTIILSRIPFLWFVIYWKYKNNLIIENTTKLNLIITFFITYLYIFWNNNLANFLFLIYIIFIVFLWINIVVNNNVIYLNLQKIPNLKEIYVHFITIYKYLLTYIKWKEFINYNVLYNRELNYIIDKEKNFITNSSILNETKLSKKLIYIPIINFIFIFNINSKYKNHIINWLIVSILFVISWVLFWFDNKYQLFLLFPLFFAIWNINDLSYKIYFFYNIYNIIEKSFISIVNLFNFLKKKKKEEHIFVWKVWE